METVYGRVGLSNRSRSRCSWNHLWAAHHRWEGPWTINKLNTGALPLETSPLERSHIYGYLPLVDPDIPDRPSLAPLPPLPLLSPLPILELPMPLPLCPLSMLGSSMLDPPGLVLPPLEFCPLDPRLPDRPILPLPILLPELPLSDPMPELPLTTPPPDPLPPAEVCA